MSGVWTHYDVSYFAMGTSPIHSRFYLFLIMLHSVWGLLDYNLEENLNFRKNIRQRYNLPWGCIVLQYFPEIQIFTPNHYLMKLDKGKT